MCQGEIERFGCVIIAQEKLGINPAVVLHILSILILTTFLFEVSIIILNTHYASYFTKTSQILLKIIAFRLKYFTHKFEVFDGTIVVISWILDVASM